MRLPIYAVWSVNWQDDYLREQTGLFARISQQIIELTARELNGKITWFAEIDQRCDIAKYRSCRPWRKRLSPARARSGFISITGR